MKAMIVLENGASFEGISIGVPGEKIGEVVLNTAVVGYQEMMTDPANAGKILVLTYPLIGNYGVTEEDFESRKLYLSGFLVRELSGMSSNWRRRRIDWEIVFQLVSVPPSQRELT